MRDFIQQWWVAAMFGGVVTGFGAGFRYLKCKIDVKQEEHTYLMDGMRALLRDRIVQAYNHYMDKGFCPIYARENIEDMFEQYTNLGGNGTISKLYEKLQKLPTERR